MIKTASASWLVQFLNTSVLTTSILNSIIIVMEVENMEKTFLQVRTDKIDKEQASDILENLGTNLSSVVNMLLKQIIMTKSIPFEVKMPLSYSANEITAEVQASMDMENMALTENDLHLLKIYQAATDAEKDNIRNQLLAEYMEG